MLLPLTNSSPTLHSFLIQLSPDSALWIQFALPSLQNPSIDLCEILNLPLSTVLALYPHSVMQTLLISCHHNFQTEEVNTNPEMGNPVPRFFPSSQLTGFHVVPQTEVVSEGETEEEMEGSSNNDGSENEEEF